MLDRMISIPVIHFAANQSSAFDACRLSPLFDARLVERVREKPRTCPDEEKVRDREILFPNMRLNFAAVATSSALLQGLPFGAITRIISKWFGRDRCVPFRNPYQSQRSLHTMCHTIQLGLRICRLGIIGLLATAFTASAWAQGTQSDYDRASNLDRRTANKVFRQNVKPHWLPGGKQFWYRNDLSADSREWIFVDAETGSRQAAFDHAKLAESLGKAATKSADAAKLPLDQIEFAAGADSVTFAAFGKQWHADLKSYALREAPKEPNKESRLPNLNEPRPSRASDEETHVTFVNRLGGDVELFWIDTDGERRSYGMLKADAERKQHTFSRHVWLVTDSDGQTVTIFEATRDESTAVIERGTRPATPERRPTGNRRRTDGTSPDGRWSVTIKEHNVRLRNVESGDDQALTTDGTEEDAYQLPGHWSPDSKKLVVMQVRRGENREIHLIESSPKDQLQPKLHTLSYAKPGDRISQPRPRLFDVEQRRLVNVPEVLFENPWSLTDLRWSPDSQRFTFLFNQRGHQVLRLLAVDAESGAVRSLIDEQSPTFIDYAHKFFCQHIDDTREVIWMSERDGWNHIYLYDSASSTVKNQITRGAWVVRGVDRVDVEQRQVWFRAGGIRPEHDPYFLHLCRVNFDGTGLTVLTAGDGTHKWEFSPDRRFLIDTFSRVDQPPVTELRRVADGSLVCRLEEADSRELLGTGWRAPERFVAKARDRQTDIFGIIIRPSNFDPQKKYPVVEQIYAGPQGAFVPKEFGLQTRQHALAELGFIVVQIDGMGTSHRSKAFHDVCAKNLADAGFSDRIAWLKAAAAKHPELDLTRVGIYGGSAGGQNALGGLLAHGDFYKVGVADCGCHDNRMDKIWWNELWMGWPIGPHYAEQSNTAQAHRLQGRLLLIFGELDRNVDPASTMQVANALVKANKDFDLLIMPGTGHGSAETPYANRRRMDFFVRHLLGVEPRQRMESETKVVP
jgi:dipeptidyl aminopeptidase/acylaminoacyl peptidase